MDNVNPPPLVGGVAVDREQRGATIHKVRAVLETCLDEYSGA